MNVILYCMQAFNPKQFDFSMLLGGVFGEISDHKREGGSAGYIDLHGAEIGISYCFFHTCYLELRTHLYLNVVSI